ncbi:MAG: NAD(P)H-hydrate epimerase [Chloroflexi bacterium]|jgi:NAD(P)H-hydrate epimerase|nr:NAD(P)H-hydrate epimerase [Chloroflexota bacterium]
MTSIPAITTQQMIEVDRLMIEEYGIELKQMMENAGRNLAALARTRFLGGDPRGTSVVVLAGSGGNGGGGLAAARRLHNWGAHITVHLSRPAAEYHGVPAKQLAILQKIGVGIIEPAEDTPLPAADLIIDALIGYSLNGAPRGAAARLIEQANAQSAPILCLDTPSGLDSTSGELYPPYIKAAATLTLALPKIGLLAPQARSAVGKIYLADISVPPQLYSHLGLEVGAIFAQAEILLL